MWDVGNGERLPNAALSQISAAAVFLRWKFWGFIYYLTMVTSSRLRSVDGRVINEYGGVYGMRMAGEVSRRKFAAVSHCRPQIPDDLTWDQARTAWVGRL
jgi:hypothetical protein